MCVFSLHGDNHYGSLITTQHAISGRTLPGHWLMNKSQITSCFLFFSCGFFYALTMAARGLIHWSCVTAIWRACVCAFVRVCMRFCLCLCARVRWDVDRYAHHKVPLHASQQHLLPSLCGLWAYGQQSRLTVVPRGMTNYLSCLIHTNSTAGFGPKP